MSCVGNAERQWVREQGELHAPVILSHRVSHGLRALIRSYSHRYSGGWTDLAGKTASRLKLAPVERYLKVGSAKEIRIGIIHARVQ